MNLAFLLPDDLDAATGGFAYARRTIEAMRAAGDSVQVHLLPGHYPDPDGLARAEALEVLGALADDQITLIDGLALGVLSDEVREHAQRLDLVALVHHPLYRESGLGPQRRQALFDSERAALRSCRRVIATSRTTAIGLMSDFDLPADQVYVAPPGTDRRERATGSGQSVLQLLCVATLVPRKGHRVLLEALAGLTTLPWQLRCVGSLDRDAVHVQSVRARIGELGLGNRVQLLGELASSTLDDLWLHGDLFVLASDYEGYGMAYAEALSAGLPIVGTTAAAVPQLTAESARLVAPGDVAALQRALAEMIVDDALRQRFAHAARTAALDLPSWADTADALRGALMGQGGAHPMLGPRTELREMT